jgi:two-component system, cell cycle response regulator
MNGGHAHVRTNAPCRILLVENNQPDVQTIKRLLKKGMGPLVEIVTSSCLSGAFDQLNRDHFDAILLSLALPDSDGTDSIRRVIERDHAPIIVLTSWGNDMFGIRALQTGADDYLVKQGLQSDVLCRAIRSAIARDNWRREIYSLSFVDELTGLYNRRAFMTVGEQQLRMARRTGSTVNLAFADLDGMKFINDHFGHIEGDRVLRDIARILRSTFRESDVIARLGGDEFAILWMGEMQVSTALVRERLRANLNEYIASEAPPYPLSLSVGYCQYKAGFESALTEMLSEGDRRMYEDKRRSKLSIA